MASVILTEDEGEEDLYAKFGIMFGDRVTLEECDEWDCLHPCYGATHERYCNQCFLTGWSKVEDGLPFEFTEDE